MSLVKICVARLIVINGTQRSAIGRLNDPNCDGSCTYVACRVGLLDFGWTEGIFIYELSDMLTADVM